MPKRSFYGTHKIYNLSFSSPCVWHKAITDKKKKKENVCDIKWMSRDFV